MKIDGNRKFGRFDIVLKLELEVKIGRCTQNNCQPTWDALSGAINYLVVFQNFFLYFYSLLELPNFTQIHVEPRLKETGN